MANILGPITVVIAVAGIVTWGDYYIKLASQSTDPFAHWEFWLGFLLYAATAFAWVWVMPQLKLATIGVVYSISTVLLLTLLGVLAFQERLQWHELCGVGLAIVAIVLLARFQ